MNKVLIHPRCKLLVQTCRSGTFNKQRTDFARTTTLGHMDAFAAFMYGNRHLDRSSPYRPDTYVPDNVFVPPKHEERVEMVPTKSFTPKGRRVFGN